ncbi:MAG: hypothetical protein ONB11_10160 [candidate division KSB1 bacterium]|nr:hypothetical protein [candidate division KSB1 bacterium]
MLPQTDRFKTPGFIYFFGVDGSGKTALAKLLLEEFQRRGIKSKFVRLRINYFFTRPLLIYAKLAGYTQRLNINGVPLVYHNFHRSRCLSQLVRFCHLMDTAIMYFFKAYLPLKLSRRTIICDRFVYDVLVDFMIEGKNHSLYQQRIGRWLLSLLPERAICLFVTTQLEQIIQRKPEVLYDRDFLEKASLYYQLDRRFHFHKLDNNGDIEATLHELKCHLGLASAITNQPRHDRENLYLQEEKVCLGA